MTARPIAAIAATVALIAPITSAAVAEAAPTTTTMYVTGYSWWDNTPPGSSDISDPVIHTNAGGTGSYDDPVTLAVGHSITNGRDVLDYPAGTRFYIPALRRYAIVEDTCGDGATPQNGPCHTGYQGHPWIDIYIGGQNVSRSVANNCASRITDLHTVIRDPDPGYVVVPGSLAAGCTVYSETPVRTAATSPTPTASATPTASPTPTRTASATPRPSATATPTPSVRTVGTVSVDHLTSAQRSDRNTASTSISAYGSEVFTVQQALQELGLLRQDKVNGHYGPETVSAVKAFQRQLDDRRTGTLTRRELSRLFRSADLSVRVTD